MVRMTTELTHARGKGVRFMLCKQETGSVYQSCVDLSVHGQ